MGNGVESLQVVAPPGALFALKRALSAFLIVDSPTSKVEQSIAIV